MIKDAARRLPVKEGATWKSKKVRNPGRKKKPGEVRGVAMHISARGWRKTASGGISKRGGSAG